MIVDVVMESIRQHGRPMLIYTLPGEPIDSAQLRWTPPVGRPLQWTPLVGGTVLYSADFKVIAVHIS